jgi:putative membrane protein
MHRRHLLLGAAAVTAFAVPASAQTRGPAPGPAPEMGPAETTHAQQTMKTGALALATSRLAVDKAQNPLLKQFAKFEVAEQETIAEIVKTMQGGNLANAEGSAPNAEAKARAGDEGNKALDKLKNAKTGADFDSEYIRVQIEGHQELLKIQETYIKSGKVREQVSVAKLARGQIKEHLTLLDYIKSNSKNG